MPLKCSVSNCRGNYLNGPKVSVFSFPTNENQRLKWIKAINRESFTPSKYSRVCELHFREHEVLRAMNTYDEKQKRWLTAALLVPRLDKDAVPSRFPECDDSTTSISPKLLEESNKATCSDDFEEDIKIEIKDEPVWLEEPTPTEVQRLLETPYASSHFGEKTKKVNEMDGLNENHASDKDKREHTRNNNDFRLKMLCLLCNYVIKEIIGVDSAKEGH